jgi:hypothetical protein
MGPIGKKIKDIKKDYADQVVIILEDDSAITVDHNIHDEPRVIYTKRSMWIWNTIIVLWRS